MSAHALQECKKVFVVPLAEKEHFCVPRNLRIIAVPLFELYDNTVVSHRQALCTESFCFTMCPSSLGIERVEKDCNTHAQSATFVLFLVVHRDTVPSLLQFRCNYHDTISTLFTTETYDSHHALRLEVAPACQEAVRPSCRKVKGRNLEEFSLGTVRGRTTTLFYFFVSGEHQPPS